MIQDHGHSGKGVGQIGYLVKLGMVEVGVEAKTQLVQYRKSLPKLGVAQQSLWEGPGPRNVGVGIERSDVPNAADPVTGGQMGIKHSLDFGADSEVGEGHYTGRHISIAVLAAGVLGNDSLHEFRFGHRSHLLGAILAVDGPAFDEDSPDDVVPTSKVAVQIVQEIAVVGAVPKMVMWIADGELRQERVLNR